MANLIVLSASQYEFFISNGKEGIDAMTLYLHLLYTARLQKTNQIWANNSYLMKGLKWGEAKVKKAKSFLKKNDFIEYVAHRKKTTKCTERHYIKLKYIHKKSTILKAVEMDCIIKNEKTTCTKLDLLGQKSTGLKSNRVGSKGQMLKYNNLNALSKKDNLYILSESPRKYIAYWKRIVKKKGYISYPDEFNLFWELYPNSKDKKKTFSHWLTAVEENSFNYDDILNAAKNYKKDREGVEKKYIKHSKTFLDNTEPWRDWLINHEKTTGYCLNCGSSLFDGKCPECDKRIHNVE